MAGLYIPDFEMPEISTEDYIELHVKGDGTVEWYISAERTRRDWRYVPNHGDLIDTGVFLDNIKDLPRINTRQIKQALNVTPVIIPDDRKL